MIPERHHLRREVVFNMSASFHDLFSLQHAFIRLDTLKKVHHCCTLFIIVDNTSHLDLLESQHLKNRFVTVFLCSQKPANSILQHCRCKADVEEPITYKALIA